MFITVEIKKRGGIDTCVPFCEAAKLFAKVAQTDVLTRQAIDAIKKLGYHVVVKQQEKFV